MSIKIYDYQCVNGHIHEVFVHSSEEIVLCKTCGEPSKRLITGGHFKLDGADLAFPTAAMKWDKRHSKEAVEKVIAKKRG